MSWLSKVFMSDKAISKTVDAAVSAGDKIFYTDEEKADDRAKMRDWYLDLLSSMSPFNVAMRMLAFIVATAWLFCVVSMVGFLVFGAMYCNPDDSCRAADAAAGLKSISSEHVTPYFAMIMAFYFGAAGVNGAIRTFRGK